MKKLFEEAVSGLESAEDTLMEIESAVADLQSDAYTSYWDLVEETIGLLIAQEQEQIDIAQAQLDAEEAANGELISTIRDNFNQLR